MRICFQFELQKMARIVIRAIEASDMTELNEKLAILA